MPWAEVKKNLITVHNIRNVDYRTEADYSVHHYDRLFTEIKKRSLINQRAKAADKASNFSRLIRVGLPGMEP